jgi:anti-sigma regulatory factor (Ser/Thr protein kinase)
MPSALSSGERTMVVEWHSLPPWGSQRKREIPRLPASVIGYPQGMRVIDLRLAARPESVPHARHALDDLAGLASQASLEDARLLVSELVTNSIRHGHLSTAQDIWLRADLEGDTLHVEVRDPGGGFELKPRTAGKEDHDSGWGLYLVGLLAERWGVNADGSTLVWFDMPLRRETEDDPPA